MTNHKDSDTSSATAQARIDSIAQDWFLLISSGSPTDDECQRFKQWLLTDLRHQQAYDELSSLWTDMDALRDDLAAQINIDTSAKTPSGNISASTSQSPEPTKRPALCIRNAFWASAMAACLAFLVIALPDIQTRLNADFQTAAGEQARVELADGSIAWLNTDTAIDVQFEQDQRRILLLKGEAQFEVISNPERPFSVLARDGSATALGTVYAVRDEGDAAVVTVSEGKVNVASPIPKANETKPGASVIVQRGEQVRYAQGAALGKVTKVSISRELSWRNGFITIHNQSLADALAEIDRYHPGRILLVAETSKLKPITARLSIQSLDNGLDALAATQKLSITRLSDYLIIIR